MAIPRALHPLLAAVAAAAILTPARAACFPMTIRVTPNPMPYDHEDSKVTVHTVVGAMCSAKVFYEQTKRKPVSFKEITVKATPK